MPIIELMQQIISTLDIIVIATMCELLAAHQTSTRCFNQHDSDQKTLIFDRDQQSFYCVDPGCRVHGNVIDLLMKASEMSFPGNPRLACWSSRR